MDWVKGANDFLIRLSGGFAVWSAGAEHWRVRFLVDASRFYAGIDHTLFVSGIVIAVLAVIFWFSLRNQADR